MARRVTDCQREMTDDPSTSEAAIPPRALLADVRPDAVLRFCEMAHFTGTLSFTTATGKGLLPVLNGVPEVSDDASIEAALDEFLGSTEGTYTLKQILPNLDAATRAGDLAWHGTMSGGGIPDLMRYCESAGLTGTLRLTHGEETCDARYERGDLVSLEVDREEDQNLERVFAWPDGAFAIQAQPLFETEAEPPPPRVVAAAAALPEPQLLRTLEVALAEIMDKRSRNDGDRPASSAFRAPSLRSLPGVAFGVERTPGTAPSPMRAPTQPGVRRTVNPEPMHGADSTVKVRFVARTPSTEGSATRHSAANLGSEQVLLDLSTRSLKALTEESAGARVAASIEAAGGQVAPRTEATPAPDPAPRTPAPPAEPFSVWTAVLAVIAITATCVALWMLYTLIR